MDNRHIQFLVPKFGKLPDSLPESIKKVRNLSNEFINLWGKDPDESMKVSGEAFKCLDHIQNEILRHRDLNKTKKPKNMLLIKALNESIGEIAYDVTIIEKDDFIRLSPGKGIMPARMSIQALKLEKALNKLKHREPSLVRFSITHSSIHNLFIFTNAGMGKNDTICQFDITSFCDSCDKVVKAI